MSIYGDVKAHVPEIMALVSRDCRILRTETKDSTLNDVFLQMMGGS